MACAVSSKSQGGIVDSVIGDVVVLQGTIELLWNDPIDPWLQACRAPGALMSQRPEGAGCGDPSRRRGGRISSARSRKAVAAKHRFHGLRRKPLVGTPAIHQATDFARE